MRKIVMVALGLLLLLAMLSSCAPASPAEKVTLRYHLQKGQTYSLRMNMEQKITQSLLGQNIVVNQTLGLDMHYDVQDVDAPGNMTGRVTIGAVRYRMESPMGKIEYDSQKPTPADPTSQVLSALVGASFTMKISPTGEVLEVSGIQEMVEEVLGRLDTLGASRDELMQTLGQWMDEKGLVQTTGLSTAVYPDHPVAVGESWSQETSGGGIGAIALATHTTWTLRSRQGGVSTIEIRSTVQSAPGAAPMEMMGIQVTYDIGGTQNGTMQVDETTGWIVHAEVNQNLEGKIAVKGGGQGIPEGMNWPITIESVITLDSRF
ncbi:MAG: DUF6263 family protein [Chloroflexia bacterium]